MKSALTVLLSAGLLAFASAAFAADCVPTTTVADLEDEVMCPLCGTSLGLARESPQAKREQALIARLIASCRTKEQIKTALVAEFGPAVLAEPDRDGFGSSAYTVPLVGGAAALALVLASLFRWRRRTRRRGDAALEAPSAPLTREDARRLDLELDRLR